MSTMEVKLACALRCYVLSNLTGMLHTERMKADAKKTLAEYDASHAEDDARDAARYRWLRDNRRLTDWLKDDDRIDAAMHGEKE